jgi:hypothetical protein
MLASGTGSSSDTVLAAPWRIEVRRLGQPNLYLALTMPAHLNRDF